MFGKTGYIYAGKPGQGGHRSSCASTKSTHRSSTWKRGRTCVIAVTSAMGGISPLQAATTVSTYANSSFERRRTSGDRLNAALHFE